jgi:hypothetical protein
VALVAVLRLLFLRLTVLRIDVQLPFRTLRLRGLRRRTGLIGTGWWHDERSRSSWRALLMRATSRRAASAAKRLAGFDRV